MEAEAGAKQTQAGAQSLIKILRKTQDGEGNNNSDSRKKINQEQSDIKHGDHLFDRYSQKDV